MKISVITVCYNSAVTIRDTIESVLSQTHPDIEYIIVDGASTDNTLSIISEYRDKIACLISEPDHGLYDAMNKGIRIATGDFIGTLNSDDIFYDNFCIEKLASFINQHHHIDATYSDLIYVARDNIDKKTRKYKLKNISTWKVRFGFMIPHPTFYARRELFEKIGLYKINYKISADFELMLRFILSEIKIVRCPMNMIKMRDGGASNAGFLSIIRQNVEIINACRENNFYTNFIFLSIKIPFKIASRFFL